MDWPGCSENSSCSSSSKASESDPSAGSSSTHSGLSNLSHIKKALCSACTDCSISPQSRGVNRCSCSHAQKARMPMSQSSVGMTTSWSATQLRKTSLPICVGRGGSHIQFRATQWAKVEWSRAVISVHVRLTSTSPLQFSQARGPIL